MLIYHRYYSNNNCVESHVKDIQNSHTMNGNINSDINSDIIGSSSIQPFQWNLINLPPEIKESIRKYLNRNDLGVLSMVCRQIRRWVWDRPQSLRVSSSRGSDFKSHFPFLILERNMRLIQSLSCDAVLMSQISNEHLNMLCGLSHLKLDIGWDDIIEPKSLSGLSILQNLTSLTLGSIRSSYSTFSFGFISNLTKLTKLEMFEISNNREQWNILMSLTRLTDLRLLRCNDGEKWRNKSICHNMKNLTTLHMTTFLGSKYECLTHDMMKSITRCTGLTDLMLGGYSHLGTAVFEHLIKLKSLKSLSLIRNHTMRDGGELWYPRPVMIMASIVEHLTALQVLDMQGGMGAGYKSMSDEVRRRFPELKVIGGNDEMS